MAVWQTKHLDNVCRELIKPSFNDVINSYEGGFVCNALFSTGSLQPFLSLGAGLHRERVRVCYI